MTEIKFTPTSPEAHQYEEILDFMGEVERIAMEPSEEELQAIIDGLPKAARGTHQLAPAGGPGS